MSHHLDAPLARQDVRLDLTDLYLFRGETGTVFAINLCHSIAGDIPVPGYHPEGMYEFKIDLDLDGDAVEDLTYRFTFDARDAAGQQRFVLRRIAGADTADPSAPGVVVAEGATEETVRTPTGLRVWAGKAEDAFYNDLDVIHAVGHDFHDGAAIALSVWDRAKAVNGFPGYGVYSIVLEAPDAELLAGVSGGQTDRRLGRGEPGHRCGRLAPDQSRRVADDPPDVRQIQR